MKWRGILAVVFVIGGINPSLAQGILKSSENLARACRTLNVPAHRLDSNQKLDGILCQIYFAGFMEGFAAAQEPTWTPSYICFPDSVSVNNMAAVFVKWVDDNPKFGHLEPLPGIMRAMREAYPCEASISPKNKRPR